MPRINGRGAIRQLIRFDGHTVVIGITGSGKTYAVKESLKGQSVGTLFFNTQMESMPNGFISAGGSDSVRDIKHAISRGAKINFVPDTDLDKQGRQLGLIVNSLYDGGMQNMILVVDEVHLFTEKEVKRQLVRVATTGRRFGIQGIWISQRPAEIPNTLMTQSRKFVVFKTNMESEYFKRYKMPGELINARVEQGGAFCYVEFDWGELRGPFRV